ncbi:MAG: hypothetical protein JSW61_12150 [Candidatus Thorarchaeota archaeon]|nr:MAG: hypothetical protein JSW61_12150 [Candidatus Thorarchaeota archaeon]
MYIVKRDTGVCMYHKDFRESIFDPHLLSSFIVAMTTFFDEASGAVSSRARAFEGSDYKIIVEFGDWAMGALSVEADSAAVREKLRRLVASFEEQFNLLRWIDLDLAVYTRFEKTVINEFVSEKIQPDSVIHVKWDWEYYTKNADVISVLRLIPRICTVRDAADFLEMPVEIILNLMAEAYFEKAVTISQPIKPDDIYQATAIVGVADDVDGISPETAEALTQLDGETPLMIAAERVKTKDLKRFLEEIALLARRHAIELISPAQATLVLYSSALQEILDRSGNLIGIHLARSAFHGSRKSLMKQNPWLAFVDLEDNVDVEIKTSLTTAAVRGTIAPETLDQGFLQLLSSIMEQTRRFVGPKPSRAIVTKSKDELEKQFPSRTYQIEWEKLLR